MRKPQPVQGGKGLLLEVGTLIIRPGGEHGVLFLHLLEGEFALFQQKEQVLAPEAATPAQI